MRLLVFALLTLLSPLASAAQWWSFESHPYYDPLIAGVRDPQLSALVPARFDRMSMMVKQDRTRVGWDIDVGAEMPIFGRASGPTTHADGQLSPGQWGWGFWIPIDFHMIEDFLDASAPIVNTDYRFSGMFKIRRTFSEDRSVAARVQFGHESTHLGDEFAIHAQRTYPRTFERINVSWEYLDIACLYEWHLGQQAWNVRSGLTMTVPFHSSYYQTDPNSLTESHIGPVTASTNWYDPYVGLEVKREGLLFHEGYDLFASSELRWRSVYDYHKTETGQPEERQASVNLIAGIRKTGTVKGFGRASPFFRYYHGVNPNGQFRNQKNFTEVGIGVRLVH